MAITELLGESKPLSHWGTRVEGLLTTQAKKPFFRQSRLPLSDEAWYKASSVYSVKNRIERPPHWITGTAKRKAWTGDQLAFPVIPRPGEDSRRIAARTQAHVAGLSHVAF